MITAERREQLLRGVDISVSAGSKGVRWCPDASSAPKWAADRIVEVRAALADGKPVPPPSRSYVRDAEQRMSMREQIARFAKRVFRPTPVATMTDAQLRAEADRLGEVIRQDAIKDPNCRAVKLVDGRFERDFDKERELNLRKKDTEAELEDSDSDDDWNDRAHARAASKHRFVAQHSSLDDAVKHYKCADAHQQAADNFTRENSRKARKVSRESFPESVIS